MSSLREFQRAFAADLLGTTPGSARPYLAVDDAHGAGWERFRIYVNHRRHTLTDALRAVFPATEAWLGTSYFEQLARQFTAQHASRSADLNAYGREFPAWLDALERTRDHALAAYPYVVAVAKLEGLIHRAFHAPFAADDGPGRALEAREIAELIARDRAHPPFIGLAPHAGVLHTAWEVEALRQYARAPEDALPPPSTDPGTPRRVLVWRQDDEVVQGEIDPALFCLLAELQSGSDLESALERCQHESPAHDPAAALASAIETGLLWPARCRRSERAAGDCAPLDRSARPRPGATPDPRPAS